VPDSEVEVLEGMEDLIQSPKSTFLLLICPKNAKFDLAISSSGLTFMGKTGRTELNVNKSQQKQKNVAK